MPGVKLSANPAGYKPSFGVGTPRRRNLTMDPHRKPVSISSDTLTEIEEGRAAYRQGIANPGKGVPRQQKETGRPDHAFQAKHVEVDMDLSEAGIKALTNKDRIKQQTVRLRQVFETMDSKHDDAIDAEELEQQLLRLGYTPTKYEAADMIWEVDDEGMGKIKWRQFKSVYNRVRMDDLGKEPRRMYNVMEFMVFDIDNDGSIDLTEVMQLFYQRYGKHALFTEQKDARGVRRQASHDITFPEFVKHDETFYTPSRQIQDAKELKAQTLRDEGLPVPPAFRESVRPAKLVVRRQNPGKLLRQKQMRITSPRTIDPDRWSDEESNPSASGELPGFLAAHQAAQKSARAGAARISPRATENFSADEEFRGQTRQFQKQRVRRPSRIIYVHYGLQFTE